MTITADLPQGGGLCHTETLDLTQLLDSSSTTTNTGNNINQDEATAVCIVPCLCHLGEGVLYDETTKSILWTDILQRRFHKLDLNLDEPSQCSHSVYALDKVLGSFGLLTPLPSSNNNDNKSKLPLLCAWEDGFQLFDMIRNVPLSEYSVGPDVNPAKGATRLNDGRTDPLGKRFICGGCNGGDVGQVLQVFSVRQEREPTKRLLHETVVNEIEITNSICFSPDGGTMYLADSPKKQIHSYTYRVTENNDDQKLLSNRKLLHIKSDYIEEGVPDGCCVDAEGYLWNAVWRTDATQTGVVQRIDPTSGRVVFTVRLPDATSQASCCCWGGPDYDILFITTAAEALDREVMQQPNAGNLYAVRLPFRGKPEGRLQFTY